MPSRVPIADGHEPLRPFARALQDDAKKPLGRRFAGGPARTIGGWSATLSEPHGTLEPREGETQMGVQVGDRIVVESERAAQPSRAGVIEEVLHEDPSRLRVRWDDGHTSILSPSAGVARITPQKKVAAGGTAGSSRA